MDLQYELHAGWHAALQSDWHIDSEKCYRILTRVVMLVCVHFRLCARLAEDIFDVEQLLLSAQVHVKLVRDRKTTKPRTRVEALKATTRSFSLLSSG